MPRMRKPRRWWIELVHELCQGGRRTTKDIRHNGCRLGGHLCCGFDLRCRSRGNRPARIELLSKARSLEKWIGEQRSEKKMDEMKSEKFQSTNIKDVQKQQSIQFMEKFDVNYQMAMSALMQYRSECF